MITKTPVSLQNNHISEHCNKLKTPQKGKKDYLIDKCGFFCCYSCGDKCDRKYFIGSGGWNECAAMREREGEGGCMSGKLLKLDLGRRAGRGGGGRKDGDDADKGTGRGWEAESFRLCAKVGQILIFLLRKPGWGKKVHDYIIARSMWLSLFNRLFIDRPLRLCSNISRDKSKINPALYRLKQFISRCFKATVKKKTWLLFQVCLGS